MAKEVIEKLVVRLIDELKIPKVESHLSFWKAWVVEERRVILLRCMDANIWSIFDTHANRFEFDLKVVKGIGIRATALVAKGSPETRFTDSAIAGIEKVAEFRLVREKREAIEKREAYVARPAVALSCLGRSPAILEQAMQRIYKRT